MAPALTSGCPVSPAAASGCPVSWTTAKDSTVRSAKTVVDGAWHYVVGVRTREGGLHLYVDGVEVDSLEQHCCEDEAPERPAAYAGVETALDGATRGCFKCPST